MNGATRYTSHGQVNGDKMSGKDDIPGLMSLFAFVRVVEAGSFAEAARRAGTSSSAMSKAISRFEQRHGVRLLHRTTHSLSLTQEGEHLLSGAQQLFNEAERLGASLAADRADRQPRGTVKVNMPGAFARACVLPHLAALRQKHPAIKLDLSFDDALIDLGAEGVDIAVRTGELARQPGHVPTTLLSYPYILCASAQYFKNHPIPRVPCHLASHDHVAFRNKGTGKVLTWQFASQTESGKVIRIQPKTTTVVDDGSGAWELMRQGFGLTWAPNWLGLEDLRAGRVVEVMRDWRVPHFTLSAIRLNRKQTPARTRAVLDFLRDLTPRWQEVRS